MPQIDFFLNREDKLLLADCIFESGARMIVDDNYDSQSYITIEDIDNYEEYLMSNVLLFILHPKTLRHPLEWGVFEKEGSTNFFIRQKYGGPTIDFYSPGIIENENKLIGPGFLSSHSYYYSNKGKFFPNEEYKSLFKKFSAHIRKNSKPIKLQKRTYWIGNNAIKSCKEDSFNLVEIGGVNLLSFI